MLSCCLPVPTLNFDECASSLADIKKKKKKSQKMWIPGREKTGTKRYKSDNKVGKSPSKSSSEAS